MTKKIYLFGIRAFMALLLGMFFCMTAGSVSTVHASQVQEEQVTLEEEEAPLADNSDAGGGGAFLLLGGFLIILLAVVIAVVSTFVSTAAISDEL